MKSIKVKFQNKKRKLSRVSSPHEKQKEVKQHQQIGFLLRENTDTQQAKNQLRKVSEEGHDFHNYCQGRVSWDCEDQYRGHSWLDDISDNQVKGVILGKINGNSNLDLRANHKPNIASTLSYGELKDKKRIQLMSRYDICEKAKKNKPYPLLNPQVELQMQANKIKSEKCKSTNGKQSMNNFYGTMKQIFKAQQQKNDNKSNHSIAQLKHKHKIILVTPKLNNCDDIEQDKIYKDQISKRQLFNNVYFKVPDFKKQKNIKRSVTVHSQPKIKQSMLLSCKKNFYLKKTNTICVLEKHMEPVNRCISLSNYRGKYIVRGQSQKQSNGILLTQPKQEVKQIEDTESQGRSQEENQIRNQQAIKTNLARLSLQKAAKTMMLRQQFERLRKLLKKQSNYEFKMQEDSPIKITKL